MALREIAEIWTRPGCRWCTRAKSLLETNNYRIHEFHVDGVELTKEDMIAAIPDAKTYPQIIISGEYVGGYDDLVEWMNEKGE